MRRKSSTAEEVMARLAGRAHGVVTRKELLGAGLSGSRVDREVRKGALIRQYPGVYRVGHAAPSSDASFMAAIKACGEGAALGGRAAGYVLGLLKGQPPRPEVIAPTERRVKGIRTHRVRRETTKVRGIPVTTVAETLVDLAALLEPEALARACHEAGVQYRTSPRHVEQVLARRPNAPGASKLRAVMRGDTPVTLSKLESEFLRLLREAGLSLPVTNRVAGGRRVDCRWPEQGLTVELDSYRFHNTRYAWEQGLRREREARGRGDEFRRYTWSDVEDPRFMLAELRRLLAGARP
jgi:Transcriptional regulator, AbiEi antitoxin